MHDDYVYVDTQKNHDIFHVTNNKDHVMDLTIDGVIVLRAGLILARLDGVGRLRLPRQDELSGLTIINTSPSGVVSASLGAPEGCAFVPVPRLQQDLSPELSDYVGDAILNTQRQS